MDCGSQGSGRRDESGELEEMNWNSRGWMGEWSAYGQRTQMIFVCLFSYFGQAVFSVRHMYFFFTKDKCAFKCVGRIWTDGGGLVEDISGEGRPGISWNAFPEQ